MSYAAAIDQLNAMVPELYTSTGHSRRKFSLEESNLRTHRLRFLGHSNLYCPLFIFVINGSEE